MEKINKKTSLINRIYPFCYIHRILYSVCVLVMSIGITEKRVLYDNPCAPIVKFSKTNSQSTDLDDFDEDDMTDDQTISNMNNETQLNPALGLLINRYFFSLFSTILLSIQANNHLNHCLSKILSNHLITQSMPVFLLNQSSKFEKNYRFQKKISLLHQSTFSFVSQIFLHCSFCLVPGRN